MNTNSGAAGCVTVLVMTCGLALGGFASPASAEQIVVTTLADIADPPFNADGPCGAGTAANLPGADGLISLREAIIAANNTNGADTITFAPSLSGGTIEVSFDDLDADGDPDPLPALCGEHTSIKGDLNGDDTPDITLEGAAFPAASFAAGLLVVSSHNTIRGLQVQHFPFGIMVQAGDFPTPGTPGTVEHTTVTNNILAESSFHGIFVLTGDAPGSVLAHTELSQNLVVQNTFFGILVLANLTAAGADTRIIHTAITDNEVRQNGNAGIFVFPQGDRNRITDLSIAHNTAAENADQGIQASGGILGGADENTVEVRIQDNTVTDNGAPGIRILGGGDTSSHNHVEARITENRLERNLPGGIVIRGGFGAEFLPSGTSVHNVVDVRIERNTLKDHGVGINVFGGLGNSEGQPAAEANNNQVRALLEHNVVEGSTVRGFDLAAGGPGVANANTLDVKVAHNTVCGDDGLDIVGEGGFSGNVFLPANQGSGNVLEGDISKNTATTVTVANGTPGNTATVTQSNNTPCP